MGWSRPQVLWKGRASFQGSWQLLPLALILLTALRPRMLLHCFRRHWSVMKAVRWHLQVSREFRELLPFPIRREASVKNSPYETSFTKWGHNSPKGEHNLCREEIRKKETLHHSNLNWKVSSCHPCLSYCHLVSHLKEQWQYPTCYHCASLSSYPFKKLIPRRQRSEAKF